MAKNISKEITTAVESLNQPYPIDTTGGSDLRVHFKRINRHRMSLRNQSPHPVSRSTPCGEKAGYFHQEKSGCWTSDEVLERSKDQRHKRRILIPSCQGINLQPLLQEKAKSGPQPFVRISAAPDPQRNRRTKLHRRSFSIPIQNFTSALGETIQFRVLHDAARSCAPSAVP